MRNLSGGARAAHRRFPALGSCAACCLFLSSCTNTAVFITPANLPDGLTGKNYSAHLTADGDTQDWKLVAGTLPTGLSLSNSGTISGVPSAAGTFEFTVRARSVNSPGQTDEQKFTILVVEQLVMTAALPTARRTVPFDYTPTMTGGTPPYAFDIIGLPAGIDYDRATGQIFGTPVTEMSGIPIEIGVSDSGTPQQSALQHVSWTIKPPGVAITTTSLPAGKVATPYSATIATADGVGALTFSVVNGILPDGLRLNRSTGVISGTPTEAHTPWFVVEVRDSDVPSSADSQEFSLEVTP